MSGARNILPPPSHELENFTWAQIQGPKGKQPRPGCSEEGLNPYLFGEYLEYDFASPQGILIARQCSQPQVLKAININLDKKDVWALPLYDANYTENGVWQANLKSPFYMVFIRNQMLVHQGQPRPPLTYSQQELKPKKPSPNRDDYKVLQAIPIQSCFLSKQNMGSPQP